VGQRRRANASEIGMTPAQILRVRKSFAAAILRLDAVSAAFCQRLRGRNPGGGAPFGGDPTVQRIKVGAALAGLVASLGQLDRIRPQLQAMGRERARAGLAVADYAELGEALIGALQEALGEAFDVETRHAWSAAYRQIAGTMTDAAIRERIVEAA
jgi:nitric oxide dioxygenase